MDVATIAYRSCTVPPTLGMRVNVVAGTVTPAVAPVAVTDGPPNTVAAEQYTITSSFSAGTVQTFVAVVVTVTDPCA